MCIYTYALHTFFPSDFSVCGYDFLYLPPSFMSPEDIESFAAQEALNFFFPQEINWFPESV